MCKHKRLHPHWVCRSCENVPSVGPCNSMKCGTVTHCKSVQKSNLHDRKSISQATNYLVYSHCCNAINTHRLYLATYLAINLAYIGLDCLVSRKLKAIA